MKKRIRKGSLLIALSLLLAMMFGMSVHAAKEYTLSNWQSDYFWEGGKEGTVTLHSGDTIVSIEDFDITVDGNGPTPVYAIVGDGDGKARWTYEGETQEFAWNVNVEGTTVTLTHIEPEPAPEEPAPETDNNSNESTKTEEPKVEEPKETEEQIFTRELLTKVAGAKAGDNVVIDAAIWHSFSAKVLEQLFAKEGVSYTFYYNYGGECFYITIPAGAVLEEGCEWYGPLKLNAMFGRTIIDKSELHATLNK